MCTQGSGTEVVQGGLPIDNLPTPIGCTPGHFLTGIYEGNESDKVIRM